MEILDKQTTKQLVESLIKELAKTQNEIKCAQGDLNKASSRAKFLIMLANAINERLTD